MVDKVSGAENEAIVSREMSAMEPRTVLAHIAHLERLIAKAKRHVSDTNESIQYWRDTGERGFASRLEDTIQPFERELSLLTEIRDRLLKEVSPKPPP